MPIDEEALARSVKALEGMDPRSFGLDKSVQQVVDETDDLFGVDGAGMMLLDDDEVLRYVAASDERGRVLERLQEQVQEGPCVDAFAWRAAVSSDHVVKDPRWPAFGRLAAEHDIRAVLGVPVELDAGAVGTLNVYASRQHAWDATEVHAIRSYARIIASLLRTSIDAQLKGRTATQLQYALDHRVLVEQAKGMLMEREHLDERAAFERIRAYARANRMRVGVVARQVLAGDLLPPVPRDGRLPGARGRA